MLKSEQTLTTHQGRDALGMAMLHFIGAELDQNSQCFFLHVFYTVWIKY